MPPRYDEWWCFEHIEIAGAFATKRTREVLTEPAVFQIREVSVGPGPDPIHPRVHLLELSSASRNQAMWCLRWELVDDWTLCMEIKDAIYARARLEVAVHPRSYLIYQGKYRQ